MLRRDDLTGAIVCETLSLPKSTPMASLFSLVRALPRQPPPPPIGTVGPFRPHRCQRNQSTGAQS